MTNKDSFVATISDYTRSQRIGIILFFLIIILLQLTYYCLDFSSQYNSSNDKARWLANQKDIDSLKFEGKNKKTVIYPFNPNFITDFKGYKLGMSVAEIDRLFDYRKQNKYVNSAAEFQAVTKVSDSLLRAISPYFKFPDWVKESRQTGKSLEAVYDVKPKDKIILDINLAGKEDLMKVYGIGDKISDRILEQKKKLGAFVSMEQMNDIWGLSEETIDKLKRSFTVKSTENIRKININDASVSELAKFPFFRYSLAKDIVIYRTMNGKLSLEDLSKIRQFPIEKIKIIALYLDF